MALFHAARIVPSKDELIADWAPRQAWGPAPGSPITTIGAFRFDDPAGKVGLETFLVSAEDHILQIPLTYREAPLGGADDALIGTMEHSALGQRWVYDGLRDPCFVLMLAAVTMTGQGEALGMAEYDGRWYIAPSNVRIQGGGWSTERVPVDGFVSADPSAPDVTFTDDQLELTFHRRPQPGPRPPIGLTATWIDHPAPVVLAAVARFADPN